MVFPLAVTFDEATVPDKKNTVVPIDVAGIEALIKTRDCPRMLVVMAAWCFRCLKCMQEYTN